MLSVSIYTYWIFKSSWSFSKNITREINDTVGFIGFECTQIRRGSQQLSIKAQYQHPQIIKNAKVKTPIIRRKSML